MKVGLSEDHSMPNKTLGDIEILLGKIEIPLVDRLDLWQFS